MSSDSTAAIADVEDYAYYVSDWIWPSPRVDLMKSMLLFFDKITLALPEDLADETINRDPVLAVPLADKGLLVNMDPSNIFDARTARKLARTLAGIVLKTSWGHHEFGFFPTITPFHYGYMGQRVDAAVNYFETLLESSTFAVFGVYRWPEAG